VPDDGGGQVKASRQSTIQSQHPIYSLLGQASHAESPTTKKKIVLPPKGAW
jgi:hypothetical protein